MATSGAAMRPARRQAAPVVPPLGDVVDMATAYAAVQAVVDAACEGRAGIRVLEAGCGSTTRVHLPADAHLTGIDMSPIQLDRNTVLHQKILGDLQQHDFGSQQFDLVICWDVLEHVPDPTAALSRMLHALAPGGLLVIAVPHLWSVKGLITKCTPFAVHAWFYRSVIGDSRVGREHSDQFPTVLDTGMAPRRMQATAAAHGAMARLLVYYESAVQRTARDRHAIVDWGFRLLGAVTTPLRGGRSTWVSSDVLLVLERPV